MPSYEIMKDAGSDEMIPTGDRTTPEMVKQMSVFNRELWEQNRNLRARLEHIQGLVEKLRRLDGRAMIAENALRLPGMESRANERLSQINAERMLAWAELCGDVAPSFPTDGWAA